MNNLNNLTKLIDTFTGKFYEVIITGFNAPILDDDLIQGKVRDLSHSQIERIVRANTKL